MPGVDFHMGNTMALARRKRKPKRFRLEGPEWVYRSPELVAGRWRVRRRAKASGKVQMLSLEAENSTEALQEVFEKVAGEK